MYICQNCHLYVTGESSSEIEAKVSDYYDKEFWDNARKEGLNDDYSDSYSYIDLDCGLPIQVL